MRPSEFLDVLRHPRVTSITPAELARRARASALVRLSAAEAAEYLEEWRQRGIVHEVAPGRWALTRAGSAMFAGWAVGIQLADDLLAREEFEREQLA